MDTDSIQGEHAGISSFTLPSHAASICMLKRSALSEGPAPAVISIWAEGTESESRSVVGVYTEEA
ncbi:hypothetical protein NQZ68_025889 [Dissostichus eleginoides]|nr:hypothetical protein NQZ68_025889 [Dissostichus eleginoides]